MAFAFDLTTRLSDVLQALLIILGVFTAYFKLKGDVTVIQTEMVALKETIRDAFKTIATAMERTGEALTKTAVNDSRITALEVEVRSLREQRPG